MNDLDETMAAFRRGTEPDQEMLRRLRATSPVKRRTLGPWWLAAGGLTTAAAALALWAWWLLPAPALDHHWDAESGTVQISPTVQATIDGSGRSTTIARRTDIEWESGTLDVSVTPASGTTLVVATPEATVTVLGTQFRVVRDAMGVTVSVQRGRVQVVCAGEEPVELTKRAIECLPVDGAGWLRRLTALRSAQATNQSMLDAADAGLLVADGLTRAELRFHRIALLAADGRYALARAEARALIADHPGLYDHALTPLLQEVNP